jgi:fimbrial chaperone protein
MTDALRKLRYLAALTALATADFAVAGSFSISPVRVELSTQQRTDALTVRNEDDKEVVVQAQVFNWSQQNGQDVLTETHDILVTPPVFKLSGNAQQIVRVASRKTADPKRELTYRLVLQEVPQDAPKEFTGLRVALRLSLPIFVTSQNKSTPDLIWEAAWQADNSLQITAKNQGDAHVQITDFIVGTPTGDAVLKNSVVKYVLPSATMTWSLRAPSDRNQLSLLKQTALTLRGSSDRGEIAAELTATGK